MAEIIQDSDDYSAKISSGEYVFNKLKKKIRTGIYKPGEKLPSEAELVEHYHVSRNTIRSAINKLVTLGMAETHQGKGTFVCDLDFSGKIENLIPEFFAESSDYISLLNLRCAVESQAAALAAIHATYKDVTALNEILDDLDAHIDDMQYYAVHDITFHLKVAEISGNKLFLAIVKMIRSMMKDVMEEFILCYGNSESTAAHHKIFDGIKTADSDMARESMRQHIQTVINRYQLTTSDSFFNETEDE